MELPKETLKHLGKLLREKTSAVVKKPLPARFLFLLSELDPRRVKEREALIGSGKGQPVGRVIATRALSEVEM